MNNDGEILSEHMPLYDYKLLNTIYLADIDYFSHHPLPNDWFELFLPPDTTLGIYDYEINLEAMIDEIIKDLECPSKNKRIEKK